MSGGPALASLVELVRPSPAYSLVLDAVPVGAVTLKGGTLRRLRTAHKRRSDPEYPTLKHVRIQLVVVPPGPTQCHPALPQSAL